MNALGRSPHKYAAALCLGLAGANLIRGSTPVALCLCAGFALATPARPVLLLAALALLGWWWGSARLDALDRSVLLAHVDTSERSVLAVTGPTRQSKFELRVPAEIRRFGRLRFREAVLLELPLGRSPPQGALIETVVTVRRPKPAKNGFDETTWLRRHGVQVALRADRWRQIGRRAGLGGIADRLRRVLAGSIAPGLHGERRGIVEGVVLGDEQSLSDDLRQRFRSSGLYHLLAVSGQNVVLVAGGALALAWLLGIPRWLGQLGALAAIAAYVLAVGAQPSVIRAGVSGALVSLAWLAARPADRWHFCLLGALVLLAWNPYTLLDPGFQLSFAAVAAIFVVVPRLLKTFEGYPLPDAFAGVIAVSTACGLATAPILWLQFHALPLLTVPANALAAPAVPPLLALAFAAALVGPVSQPAASAIAWLNGWFAAYLAACARVVGGLPGAQVRSGRALLVLLVVTAVAGAYAWRRCQKLLAAYLIRGTDKPKVARALRRLRDRVGEDATEHLSAHESSGEDVAAACNALGLFTVERRLVVVEAVESWKAADLKAVQEYLERPAPTTVLALLGEDVKKDSALAKAIAKAGEVLNFDLPTRGRSSKADLPKWVQQQFRDRGVQVDQEAARAIVELVGENAQELATEVDKLTTWAAGEAIGEREVVELVPARAETPPFDLTDSWGRRDVPGALAASERLVERSGDASRDVLLRTAGLLTNHVGRVRECQEFDGQGVPPGAAAERLKRNRFYVQKLYEQARNYTPEELGSAIVRLADLDLALKGGSKLPGELEFARALIEITRPAEPAKSAAG